MKKSSALLWALLALFALRVAGQALVAFFVLAAFVIAMGHSHRGRLAK